MVPFKLHPTCFFFLILHLCATMNQARMTHSSALLVFLPAFLEHWSSPPAPVLTTACGWQMTLSGFLPLISPNHWDGRYRRI